MGLRMPLKEMIKALLPDSWVKILKTINMKSACLRQKKADRRADLQQEKSEKIKARQFYEMYFKPKVDSIYPVLRATHETHNFTYDLTDRSLWYLADTIACALNKPRAEI